MSSTTINFTVTGYTVVQSVGGPPGLGVPAGGSTGQSLTKASNTDYDTQWTTPAGAGDMLASVYDPASVVGDAFARANHTGTQALSTISDAGALAALNTIGASEIDNAAVTLAKMANLAANSIIGNNTGSAATPIAMTISQAKTLLAIAIADVTGLQTALDGKLVSTDIDTLAELNAILTDATLIDTGDSRLSDARTPTAHATSHHSGGSDALSLGSIAGTVGTTQIADSAATNAKLADMAAWTFKMRNAATTGAASDAAVGDITEQVAPTSGHKLIGFDTGAIRLFDVGNLPTSGGGEANTASNQGIDGVGPFDTKSGVDLQFRNIAPGSTKVSVALNVKDIDIDVVEANLTLANLGGNLAQSRITDLVSDLAGKQPLDALLTAIAALTTAADQMIYSTGSDAVAMTGLTAFIRSLLDDVDAATARGTLGVDVAGTDNSTDVTLAGTPDYITIAGQVITRNPIDLTTDITGDLPVADGGTGASDAGTARTNLGLGNAATATIGTGSGNVAPGDIGQRNTAVSATTATTTIDLSGDDEDVLSLTLATATTALGFSNSLDRKRYTIRVIQDATGGRAITQGASIKTASGTYAEAWPTFTGGTANQYGYLVVVGNSAGGVDFATFTGWYT